MERTKKEIIKSVLEYAKVVDRIFENVEVRLYGSYHNNTAGPQSDIDVAVISDDFKDMDYLLSLKILNRLRLGLDLDIEPISMTFDEFINPQIGSIACSVAASSEIVYKSEAWY